MKPIHIHYPKAHPTLWACVLACLAMTNASLAVTIVDQDFSGVSDPTSANWYTVDKSGNSSGVSATTSIVDGSSPYSINGNTLYVQQTSTYEPVLMTFTATTLGAAGSSTDTLKINFDLRIIDDGDLDQILRFGFYNSNGSQATSNNTTADRNDFGYRVGAPYGPSSTTSTANIIKETGTDDTVILSGSDSITISAENTGSRISDACTYNVTLTLTNTAEGILISMEIYSYETSTIVATQTGIDTSDLYLTFDTLAIGSAKEVEYSIDNVLISQIPEASSAILLGLGAGLLAGFLRWRRRR